MPKARKKNKKRFEVRDTIDGNKVVDVINDDGTKKRIDPEKLKRRRDRILRRQAAEQPTIEQLNGDIITAQSVINDQV